MTRKPALKTRKQIRDAMEAAISRALGSFAIKAPTRKLKKTVSKVSSKLAAAVRKEFKRMSRPKPVKKKALKKKVGKVIAPLSGTAAK